VATTKTCPDNLTQLEFLTSSWAVFEAIGPFPELTFKIEIWIPILKKGSVTIYGELNLTNRIHMAI